MQMSVKNRPPGIPASIEHKPITTLGEPQRFGHSSPRSNHLGQHIRSSGSQRQSVLEVRCGHHQHVMCGLRIDVPKRQGPRCPVHHVPRNLPGHDLAEQAVRHQIHAGRLAAPRPTRRPRGRGPGAQPAGVGVWGRAPQGKAADRAKRTARAHFPGGCVAVKSGGHSTATQRAPDRGGRCPAGREHDGERWQQPALVVSCKG